MWAVTARYRGAVGAAAEVRSCCRDCLFGSPCDSFEHLQGGRARVLMCAIFGDPPARIVISGDCHSQYFIALPPVMLYTVIRRKGGNWA